MERERSSEQAVQSQSAIKQEGTLTVGSADVYKSREASARQEPREIAAAGDGDAAAPSDGTTPQNTLDLLPPAISGAPPASAPDRSSYISIQYWPAKRTFPWPHIEIPDPMREDAV